MPASNVDDDMIRCMAGFGWQGKETLGASLDFGNVPAEQSTQFTKDEDACVKQTGWGDLAALTDAQRKVMYQREVAEYHCLVMIGLTPPTPPTEQTYLDTFHSANQYYAGANLNLAPAQVKSCPPPTWFMNR